MSKMNRKKVAPGGYSYDDDEDYVPTKKVKYSATESNFTDKVKKHTLDSDEEDDENDVACNGDSDEGNADRLNKDEIDGEEEQTIDHEGENTITPFNMKEEMEDGHFDRDGFYHFKKDNDIKDAWLEDIDWVKVKRTNEVKNKYGSDDESDQEMKDDKEEQMDILKNYTEIFTYLNPGESIEKALKRLGGNKKKLTSAQKWKMKKLGKPIEDSSDSMKKFFELTELVNKLISAGNMDAYQETYEMINLKLEKSKAPAPEPLDMFSSMEESTSKDETENKEEKTEIEVVKWRFRWKNEDGEKIHGPFSSEEMLKWQNSGYFEKGVYVQKMSETSGDWFSSKRIDFDIYV